MNKYGLLVIVFLLSFSFVAFSQIQLTNSGYSQDFNSLADTGSSSLLPDGWYLSESGTDADSLYSTSTGSSRTGDTYSFGLEDSTERAFGSIRSGSLASTFGANFTNNSGEVITSIHISYTGEQWRAGSASRTEADTLKFQYSINATSLSDGDWINIKLLDFFSPNTGISGTLDGNLPENSTEINSTITGLSIPAGSQFWIRWQDVDVSSSDDGLAIDDFSIDLTVPTVIFSITPVSLNFDTVDVGSSNTLHFTIKNEGTTDNLVITNIESVNPVFNFISNTLPLTIPPDSSRIIDVTFTPTADGTESGAIIFTHNAPGSPASITLTGTGKFQLSGGLLKFKSSVKNLLKGSTGNPDTVVLSNYSGQPLKALQFKLLIGNSNGGLILRSVSRGKAIPANQFNFNYEIYRGTYLPDGSSIDTVKIVILGNGTNAIIADQGEQDIIEFSYDILNISGDSMKTFNHLSDVLGATGSPVTNADLGTGPDETINIITGTVEGMLGDVNLDNQVNILDILCMIDYIIGRVQFSSDQFLNGDVSPWALNDPLPERDGKIDVLDLAVLQNIVLTGKYPSNSPIHKKITKSLNFAAKGEPKLTPGMNAKVTFYFTDKGISIGLETLKKVKGLQIELSNIDLSIPQNTKMASIFRKALYCQNNSSLTMLCYDDKSGSLEAGKYLIASIPFDLVNPKELVVENLIVAGENNNSIQEVEVEIAYDNPNIPVDYNLSQNYPNPFNPTTLIKYSVPKDDFVTIKIFNMIGQEIITLFSGNTKEGTHTLIWNGVDQNGKQVSSGSYIYRMTAGEFSQSK
ncbi:MAG: choice-of-anchor D domain-containing protein, partial [Ignavibacteriaceae bacterium]